MLIDVAIPVPLNTTFTYDVPAELVATLQPGMRVKVTMRRKSAVAVVTALNTSAPAHAKIRMIDELLDQSRIMSPTLLELCQWISDYYAAPIGEVIQSALPPHFWKAAKKSERPKARLPQAHTAHVARTSVIPLTLLPAQNDAVQKIAAGFGKFSTVLLHGVTGSGKTEVYMAACTEAIARGEQAIVLVPEIALTPQLLGRFTERFGDAVAVYHSGLTELQRAHQWQRIALGEASIVVGTRSAIFSPTPNCGLIIVDEEHDSSYKQDSSPRYNGRDVAVMRAKMESIPVILGSATPSLESLYNAHNGKYQLITLSERATGQTMPSVQLVDMRALKEENKPLPLISPQLIDALQKRLEAREQSMLLINRRGFSQFVVCESCGHVATCPNCDLSLTYHHSKRELRCHYCDYHIDAPENCEHCKSQDLKPIGAGAERIEDVLKTHFPTARIARLDSDAVATQGRRTELLQAMHNQDIDILVGTQMIAKGHDFSHVTLVGVISAEMSLNMPDFRAPERSFQLLTQASGRAGRAHLPGEVLIQTIQPEHYCLQHVLQHDYTGFAAAELAHREGLRYPPFGRLIACTVVSNTEKNGLAYAETLGHFIRNMMASHAPDCAVLGPAPALLYRLRGKTRMQLLLKLASATQVPAIARHITAHAQEHAPSGVQLTVDVDPLNFV